MRSSVSVRASSGLNIGYNPGVASRTINTSFAAGTHLVELTGNWQDASGQVPQTIVVNNGGTATIKHPVEQCPKRE